MSSESEGWIAGESYERSEVEVSDAWEPESQELPNLGCHPDEEYATCVSPDSRSAVVFSMTNDKMWIAFHEEDLEPTESAEEVICYGCQRPTPMDVVRFERGEPHCPICRGRY